MECSCCRELRRGGFVVGGGGRGGLEELLEQAKGVSEADGPVVRRIFVPAATSVCSTMSRACAVARSPPPAAARRLSGAWTRLGRPELASAAVREIADLARAAFEPEYWPGLFGACAEALAQAGAPEPAAELAAEAAELLEQVTDPDERQSHLAMVICGLAASGSIDTALTLVNEAIRAAPVPAEEDEYSIASTGLSDISRAVARTGRHAQAAELARRIPKLEFRTSALTSVAEECLRAEALREGIELAREAADIALGLSDADGLGEIAQAMADANLYEEALALGRGLEESDHQEAVLAATVGAVARSGAHERCAELARSVRGHARLVTTLASAALALAEEGASALAIELGREAAALTRTAPAAGHCDKVRSDSAQRLVWAKQFDVALAVADTLPDAGARDGILEDIASWLRFDDIERACTVAGSIADLWLRGKALAEIADYMAIKGRHEDAVALAHQLPDPVSAVEVLSSVSRHLLWDDQGPQSLDLARELVTLAEAITDDDARDRAPVVAVRSLALPGAHDEAAELVSAILDPARRAEAQITLTRVLAHADRSDPRLPPPARVPPV